MIDKLVIRNYEPSDIPAMLEVARTLPEWFTPTGMRLVMVDLNFQDGLIARLGGDVVAFLSYYVDEGVAFLSWMGVRDDLQRRGVGRRLIDRLVSELEVTGVTEIRAFALSESISHPAHARTREFFLHNRFAPIPDFGGNVTATSDRLTMRRQLSPPAPTFGHNV